ncbi:MAG: hypothetical protein AB7G13_23795 [Lautropia sp.]
MNTTLAWRTRGIARVLGHDVPHDGGIMTRQMVQARVTDPEQLVPHLFEEHDPGFMERVRPGDFIVAGRNFGCGKPHTNGYRALQHLGLRLLCESVPGTVARAMMNLGLPCLQPCDGLTAAVADGDEIEVDFTTGELVNHTRGARHRYPAMSIHVRHLIERGGQRGLLEHWLAEHPELREPWPDAPQPLPAAPRSIPITPV